MRTHLLVALGLSLMAAAPLTYPGLLQTHAGLSPAYALLGDPVAAAAVGPLALSLAQFGQTAIRLDPDSAFKLVGALSFILGALGVFLLARPGVNAGGALVASTVYSFLPYRLMTSYIRGADGESLFLALLPWLIIAARSLSTRASSHLRALHPSIIRITTWGLCFIAVLILWRFCVPYMPDPAQAQAYLFQVFSARWDYGGHGDWLSAPSLQLGIVPLALALIALVAQPDRRTLALAALAAALTLLSIEPLAGWWPWAWFLSEPWQLLGVAGLCLSLMAGSLIARHAELQSLPSLAAIILLITLGSYAYLSPRGLDYTATRLPLARYDNLAYAVDAITPPLQPGTTVTITLLWQDIAPFTADYKVFVHIIDNQEKIWDQRDAQPLNGARPTQTWQRGELLRDSYMLAIPADAPAALRLAFGLYRSDTGQRLLTTTAADRVVVSP